VSDNARSGDRTLIILSPEQATKLREWFLPDRPGPLIGLHVLQTGHGSFLVDRWPDSRVALVETAGNYSLAGDPMALAPGDLRGRITGFLETPERFEPLVREAFPSLRVWERVIFELKERPSIDPPPGAAVRRLQPSDAAQVSGLRAGSSWIAKTWGGPTGLAESGHAWGAFVGGRLVSVACAFFVAERYEDIGVATEPEHRAVGLSVACAGALCEDVERRGRRPSWTTSPDNTASLRVAEKLGFELQRHDRLFVIGADIPRPARRAVG
jgi:RimJ/RimL family protein N-acetyltransferase